MSSGRQAGPGRDGRDGRDLLREAFSTGDGGNVTHRVAASSTVATILRFFGLFLSPSDKKHTQRKLDLAQSLTQTTCNISTANNVWTFCWWTALLFSAGCGTSFMIASYFPLISQYRVQTRDTTHTYTMLDLEQVAAVVCWWIQLQLDPPNLHFTSLRCFLSFFTPHNDPEKLRCQPNGQSSEERKGGTGPRNRKEGRGKAAERKRGDSSRDWKERFRLWPSACPFKHKWSAPAGPLIRSISERFQWSSIVENIFQGKWVSDHVPSLRPKANEAPQKSCTSRRNDPQQ